jgi:mannose-1-phosphate guanylyltransferase
VTAFLEKPTRDADIVTDQINAGCYVFQRSVIDRIPAGRVVSVERETFPELLESDALVSGVVDSGYWLDLGTPLAFVQGSRDLVLGRAPSPAVPNTGDALIMDGAVIAPDAHITGGSTIGARARVDAGSRIDGSVVFDDAHIADGCTIVNSIIGFGARIGTACTLNGVVVGDGASIGAHNELLDGMRIWPNATIADLSMRFSSDR